MMDDVLKQISAALDADAESQLDEAFAIARAHWREIQTANGDPAAIVLVMDRLTLPVHYTTTTIRPSEAFYYLTRAAHDFVIDEFQDAAKDEDP